MEVILKPIEVIVNFKKDGSVRPVRLRLIGDDTGYEVINVNRMVRYRQEKAGLAVQDIYTLTGIFEGMERMFEIKFDSGTGSWTLYRM